MTAASTPVEMSVADGVATVCLHRPPMNPIDTAMPDALIPVTRRLADDGRIRACVVSGGPSHFAAGADIEQLSEMTFEDVVDWNAALQQAFTAVAALPFPVIAAVNGYALGGGLELALAADVRIGSRRRVVGFPEITLGIIPGSGGTQRLTQIVDRGTAKLLSPVAACPRTRPCDSASSTRSSSRTARSRRRSNLPGPWPPRRLAGRHRPALRQGRRDRQTARLRGCRPEPATPRWLRLHARVGDLPLLRRPQDP